MNKMSWLRWGYSGGRHTHRGLVMGMAFEHLRNRRRLAWLGQPGEGRS